MLLNKRSLAIAECEVKFAPSMGTFEGYAAVFGGKDAVGDIIQRGAFTSTLRTNGKPKMFLNHKLADLPIGKYTTVAEDEKGLYLAGELTPGNGMADNVKAALSHGTVDGLSIGYFLSQKDYEPLSDGGRLIKRIANLLEVSIVTFPADSAARIDQASVKSEEIEAIESVRDFELVLRDAGLSKGLAVALAARAKVVFAQGEPGREPDVKGMREVQTLINQFAERASARLSGI